MANHTHIIPFIKNAEGGHVNDPTDKGGDTNKGITYAVWCSVFGSDCYDRFIAMSAEDWELIFVKLFWTAILGDKINSQRIADLIVDWVWGSGKHYPEMDVQEILIHCFFDHIVADGCFGPATIDSINAADEEELYKDLVAKRFEYLDQVVKNSVDEYRKKNPEASAEDIYKFTDERFISGWKNRMNNLIAFEGTDN